MCWQRQRTERGSLARYHRGVKISDAIRKIAKALPEQVAAAVYQEALELQKAAMRRCPLDTGALRASHETTRPERKGNDWTVAIRCGGPAAPYALVCHEDLSAEHPVGEAKWLERTIQENARSFPQRVAKRIDVNRLR
jgi:hypothetical protein